MPIEILQFGGFLAVIVVVALLWFVFVYKARRTGEGEGAPREKASSSRPAGKDEGKS
jgi:hypothetical protein